ncbi:MAG TPA: hypothetical protein VNX68_04740 [Nitrosopumilaceae archaeon]|jgi:hypothetical protein|nr:hypothetical protein [Nitrosopumilaceae archaeon]
MPFNEKGEWRPNIKQEKLLAVPNSIKEAALLGGAGTGKSELLLMIAIVNKWHENGNFKQVFMRRTFPELRSEIVPRSKKIYPRFGGTFNKTDMVWTFDGCNVGNTSGGLIFLGHCENESDVNKYDTMEINLFTPDEITSLTEYIYLYIGFTRVRTSDKKLPAIIRGAGMPGGIGHGWVKKRFIDPYPTGGKILRGRGGNKRIFIFATLADNPHIDPEYSQSLEALPEAEKKAKKYGDWDAYAGQVFSEFRALHYATEPDNYLHIIEPFDIPSWWPRICAIDWGWNPGFTVVQFGAISPSKRLYLYRELQYEKILIEDWCNEVKPMLDREGIEDIVICHSAGQHRGEPQTIHEQVIEGLGRSVRLGERDRIGGKMLLHEYLRCKPLPIYKDVGMVYAQERAEWILRNRTLDDYKLYLSLFNEKEPETNLPKLQIFNTCKYLPDAIKACIYSKVNKDDVEEFVGDDPYDTVRMLIRRADSYFDEASDKSIELKKRQLLIDQFKASGDMTAFYRNARKLEVDEEVLIQPIKRYHRVH